MDSLVCFVALMLGGHARAQVRTVPQLGSRVPELVLRARSHDQQCLTDVSHYDPCASIKIRNVLFTIAWDADTRLSRTCLAEITARYRQRTWRRGKLQCQTRRVYPVPPLVRYAQMGWYSSGLFQRLGMVCPTSRGWDNRWIRTESISENFYEILEQASQRYSLPQKAKAADSRRRPVP
jgi:hypothetical protein